MKLSLDTNAGKLSIEEDGRVREVPLYSTEGFNLLSRAWIKVGWNQKYTYTFSWLGRPIIQLPEDLLRIQEVIYTVRPDVIVETGVAHGGSLVYYASLLTLLGRGRVVGIEIQLRPVNRKAIMAHPLADRITLVDRGSTSPEVSAVLRGLIKPNETVMVVLDSAHTRAHVFRELEVLAPFVTVGSYIVATDGVMKDLSETPRGRPEWKEDNPWTAACDFATRHPEFVVEQPPWPFNESELNENVTHWPGAYLRRVKAD